MVNHWDERYRGENYLFGREPNAFLKHEAYRFEKGRNVKQMSNGSGMLSFGLHAGYEGARRMMDRLDLITRAVSLGDADSLICHPASFNRARQPVRQDVHMTEGVGDDLIRLSVGLEAPGDIIGDLRQALEVV